MSTQPRVELPLGVTTEATSVQGSVIGHYLPSLLERRNDFFHAAMKTDVLNEVTKEIIRLRSALITDCDL